MKTVAKVLVVLVGLLVLVAALKMVGVKIPMLPKLRRSMSSGDSTPERENCQRNCDCNNGYCTCGTKCL